MKNIGWISQLRYQRPSPKKLQCAAAVMAGALLMGAAAAAVAQDAVSAAAPAPETPMSIPNGYTAHHSVDVGGRMTNRVGSGSMYDTLVNLHSGPRVLGETFELHALPGKKHTLLDDLSVFGSGFGGDPYNFAKLDASKGNVYEFSGIFRRDRSYFDYDLLGNPNITTGRSIPIGPSSAPVGQLAWPQVMQSPVLFNIVRRMTDTNLTLRPQSTFTYRVGYSHNTMEGPSLSPSYSIMKYDALLAEQQRHSTDTFFGALDWKPRADTKISFEETVVHYKGDSFFALAPNQFLVQEADGTKAYLGNWDSQTAYNASACNTTSMGGAPLLSPANTPGGLPIINAACAVVTSYMRAQPMRVILPTEALRLQSSAIKHVTMNGNIRYTLGNMDMPNYYENAMGLSGTTRDITYSGGYAKAHRAVIVADFGIVWQLAPRFSLTEQINYSSFHQPSYSNIPVPVTLNTPSTAGSATINYSGPLTAKPGTLPHGINGTLTPNFLGQGLIINNLTATWDVAPRAQLALTYRHSQNNIGEGVPHTGPLVETDPVSGGLSIVENGGILNIATHPAKDWDLNGSVEIAYFDNAFTPMSPRQLQQYRMHTIYRPKTWATFTGSFSDRERHNNTNNNQEAVAAGDMPFEGPLDHVDHSRVGSVGAVLSPNEHYAVSFNYSYSDVYSATNICYNNGATPTLPGAATVTASGAPAICPGIFARGSTTQLADWLGRDFMDAPTQYGLLDLTWSPTDKIQSNIGYNLSSVNGSRFFNDARDVNGSMVSTYQTPFVNVAWTQHPGLVWKAEYDFFGYGEGGPSGAQLCSTSTSFTATVVPCTSLPYPTGLTEPSSGLTAPRNFHASNVMLGMHYEF